MHLVIIERYNGAEHTKYMIGFADFSQARIYQLGASQMAAMQGWTRHGSVGYVSHLDNIYDLYNEGSIVVRKLGETEEVRGTIWQGYIDSKDLEPDDELSDFDGDDTPSDDSVEDHWAPERVYGI